MDFDKVATRSVDVIEGLEVEEVIKALKDIFENLILEQDIEKLTSDS
jgi:hypothetical protein